MKDSSSLICSDFYLIAFHGQYKFKEYFLHGKNQIVFDRPANSALEYDLKTNGIRFFHFYSGIAATLE